MYLAVYCYCRVCSVPNL
uniref:Uncharacterized protein n=1 Tax=Arundo donax TaxID=35708 RepID=A0A0A9HQ28_ARUDO